MIVLGNAELEPDFKTAQNRHTECKQLATRGYVKADVAAMKLNISSSIFALITGNVLIKVNDHSKQKFNIGLRLKLRQFVSMNERF